MRFRLICVLIIAGLLFPACSLRQTGTAAPQTAPGAEELSSELNRINDSLNTFKGLGRAQLTGKGRSFSARVAWAGAAPGQLRVEVVNTPGVSKTGFSSDGAWLYYYDSRDSGMPVKRISTKDASLKKFVSVSINPDEVVSLLSGRPPEFSHQTLRLERAKNDNGYILTREKKWWKGSQKIFLDKTKKSIKKIETYAWNQLRYKAEFRNVKRFKGYRIPSRLVISNEQGDAFQLDIDKFWANASIPPDMFVLHPPSP